MTEPSSGEPAVEGVDKAPRTAEKTIDRAADRVRGFLTAHTDARATIDHLGRGLARIVLVSGSGDWGDVVVRSMEQARLACERAGIAVTEWDRETAAQVDLSPAYRIRMAGTGR
ncbi:hypothetical protein ABLG96_11405 [Nakamurella sp. A5-74]|uniref:Uncharacterized protein n=1 Tax=Nakamurella sp. A5-74 TaxID=3158264 RepID=A0AAU8DLU5_9ACTN